LDSWFQSMVGWLHCFESEARQNIMARGCDGAQLVTSWAQEVERQEEEGSGHHTHPSEVSSPQ
jgi:hypothetical protein